MTTIPQTLRVRVTGKEPLALDIVGRAGQRRRSPAAAILGGFAHRRDAQPKGFMDAVLSTARRCGWSEEQLHHEFRNKGRLLGQKPGTEDQGELVTTD